jgi:hypothetical protein
MGIWQGDDTQGTDDDEVWDKEEDELKDTERTQWA